jgi:hypothetical protein
VTSHVVSGLSRTVTVRLKADTTYGSKTVRLKADITYGSKMVRLRADDTHVYEGRYGYTDT